MDTWESNWEVGNRQAADRRIWRVHYLLIAENAAVSLPTLRPVTEIVAALKQNLAELLVFCEQQRIQGFDGNFRRAIECLDARGPGARGYHPDLAPDGVLDESAWRLLAASQAAWVFGGMGSWNDMGFEEEVQAQYDRLSENLFTLLNEAIQAAVNSSA